VSARAIQMLRVPVRSKARNFANLNFLEIPVMSDALIQECALQSNPKELFVTYLHYEN
jgi:hypothetical protein